MYTFNNVSIKYPAGTYLSCRGKLPPFSKLAVNKKAKNACYPLVMSSC